MAFLVADLAGIHNARLGRDWQALCEIDDANHPVMVFGIHHRQAPAGG